MIKIVLTLLLLLPFCPVYAEELPSSPLELAEKIQHTYDQMQSLRFHFQQETSGEMTGRPQQGEGDAVFLRGKGNAPKKMRWHYSRPDEQIILSDGVSFFMYFKKLKQMIISPAQQLSADLTYSFFTGAGNLLQDFDILPVAKPDAIKLIPRTPQQQVAEIELQVDEHFLLTTIIITDHFGTITTLSFDKIEVNPLENEPDANLQRLFSFTPPVGTEIIEQ